MTSFVLSSDKYFIGLTDMEDQGEFKWMSSKQSLGYESFKSGEPTNAYDKNCVVTENGQWIAEACNSEFYFVCQKSPA